MVDLALELMSAQTASDFLAIWLRRPMLSPVRQRSLEGYYARFRGLQSRRMRHWYNEQISEAEKFIAPGVRVLEIGVGSGSEFLWWARRGASVVGIEPLPDFAALATERVEVLQKITGRPLDCSVLLTTLDAFKDSDGFDVIWLEQAFHHLEPRKDVVEKIARLLRPGGRVILSEANALNPLLQLQLLKKRGLKMYIVQPTENGSFLFGNERVLWHRPLARWFRRVGIEQETVRYYRIFPSHPAFERLFEIERRITGQWLAPIYSHYNFVGRKCGSLSD